MNTAMPPKPEPPICPDPADCCDSGCSPCIFDFYQEELDRYREELAAWERARAAESSAGSQTSSP